MKQRNLKKGLAVLLATALLAGVLGGCGKNAPEGGSSPEQPQDTSAADKGRYVEQEEILPEALADWSIQQLFSVDGELHLLVSRLEEERTVLQEWARQEDGFKDVTKSWLTSMDLPPQDWMSVRLVQNKDGQQYLYAGYIAEGEDSFLGHLWKENGDTATEITPEKWSVLNEDWGMYEMIQGLAALDNGTLAAVSYTSMDILSGEDGSVIETRPISGLYEGGILTDGENTYLCSSGGNGGEIEKRKDGMDSNMVTIPFPAGASGSGDGTIMVGSSGSLALSVLKDGTLIAADENGIFRLPEGNPDGEWEKLVDGVETDFSMTDYACMGFAALEDGSIYALIQTGDRQKLNRYEYDPEAVSQVAQVLKVYTVFENPTLKQAAILYHKAHPETLISIEYEYPMYSYEHPDYDAIYKKLNTTLMGDDAPDLLVMDHLNMDSYASKGLLTDLDDIVRPLEEDGTLLSNITSTYVREEGKRYVVPLLFGFQLAIGRDIPAESMRSMEALADFLSGADYSYMGPHTPAELVDEFYPYFCDELVNGKQLDKEATGRYLEYLKAIADNCGIINTRAEDSFVYTMWELADKAKLAFTEADGFTDCMFPMSMVDYIKGDFTAFENRFIPSLQMGVCVKSRYQDIAKDFLLFALSEQAQNSDFSGGFPVNKAALQKQETKDRSTFTAFLSIAADDGGTIDFESKAYSPETAARLSAICQTLDRPIKEDAKIREVLAECLGAYLDGTSTKEDTVQKIEDGLKMYLAE